MTQTLRRDVHKGWNMPGGMEEATRLVREGRLADATAKIQTSLGSPMGSYTGTPTAPEAPPETIRSGDVEGLGVKMPDLNGLFGSPGGIIDMPRFPDVQVAPEEPATGGRSISRSYANAAGTRAYKLYVPSGADGAERAGLPLVVMLHGCTQSADDFAAGTRMNALAEGHDFYVLYPEQAGSANLNRCWNWFEAKDQRRGAGEPSIIAGMTQEVVSTHPIDPSRVYVAGMSAGGAMAVVMGATHPDLFAAVGVHSGLPYGAATDMPSAFRAMQGGASGVAPVKAYAPGSGEAADLTREVPTIVFHGDRDATVNPRNGEQVLHQWTQGGASSRATVRQGRAPGGRDYTRSVYQNGEGEPIAERWIVHGAGHAWSGGSSRGSYTDPQGPDASAEMARFFLEHPKR